MVDNKNYIVEQYKLAKSDYLLAKNEADRANALRDLHELNVLATEMYGFDFADSLTI